MQRMVVGRTFRAGPRFTRMSCGAAVVLAGAVLLVVWARRRLDPSLAEMDQTDPD